MMPITLTREIHRDTYAEVNLPAIQNNVQKIKARLASTVKLMAVIKADGYGHGDVESAWAAIRGGADMLAVAYLSEGLRLRQQGITLPILILTPIGPEETQLAVEHHLMLTVTTASWFKEMRAYKHPSSQGTIQVHIKLDTGLGRIGIRERQEWEEMIPFLKEKDVLTEGVYTHFATAGQTDTGYLEKQYHRFVEMISWVKESGVNVNRFHCANSAAALRFPELAMDMVRIGAALYGFYPQELVHSLKLEPALSLYSKLIHVKKVKRGELIGYDNSYRAEKEEWIGTVPIGYADGWTQCLRGSDMLVDGQRVPIIGKIGMDQLMIRLPRCYQPGTLVTLIGRQGKEQITCSELASYLDSVPQEVSSSITSRVMRKHISYGY